MAKSTGRNRERSKGQQSLTKEAPAERKSKVIGFSAAPDLLARLRHMADAMNVTLAKVVDGLIRDGLEYQTLRIGTLDSVLRLERSVERVERMAHLMMVERTNLPHREDCEDISAEMALIAAVLSDGDCRSRWLSGLKADVFGPVSRGIHSAIWVALSDPRLSPGARGEVDVEELAKLLDSRGVGSQDFELKSYLQRLQSIGLVASWYADPSGMRVLDTHLAREISEFALRPPKTTNLFEILYELEMQLSHWRSGEQ